MLFSKCFILQKPLFSSPQVLIHFRRESIARSNLYALKTLSDLPNISEAIKILERSNNVGIDVYARLLESCIRSKSFTQGKRIHQHLLKNTTHMNNSLIQEKLICMYIACGDVELARLIFNRNSNPDIFLWNSMIRAYAWNGPFDRAIDLYNKMIELSIKPNKFTYPFVLKACSSLQALKDGKEIHDHAKKAGLDSDVFVSTALIDLYIKCGCLEEARSMFDKMPKRDVVAWNAMIAGSALHGLYKDTIHLFLKMQEVGKSPNASTIVAVLPAVGQANALIQGSGLHCYCIRRLLDKDVLVGTAILDMYGKCVRLTYAQRVFNIMTVKNEVTWSAIIGAYVLCDLNGEALRMFNEMLLDDAVCPTPATLGSVLRACARLIDVGRGKQIHGYTIKSGFISDVMVGNTLLSMYSKAGMIDDSITFFNEIVSKDTVSYSAIISGCVQNGNVEKALLIFREMQISGIEPDIATMIGVIPACAHLADLQLGRRNHGCIIVRGFASETSIGNALIDMYSKCGRIDVAREVFDRIPHKDVVSWNAMIAGYGLNGFGREAIILFHAMQSECLKPDDVTFICLLSACSHSGLVEEGKHWFNLMNCDFNIIPRIEHYICMVDLLGRGALLDEALNFIKKMPLKPDVRVWGALLGACRIHENIELGEEVSKIIQKLGPEGTGNFVLLSNIYSAAGRWDDAAHVRVMQRDLGFRKSPGCSWIEVHGSIHAFVGGDRSHPQSSKIYNKLEELLVEIRKLGYHVHTSFVLQDVEEEEKEQSLLFHSEKLAIAFGILSLSPGKPIVITKNLRVCGDCHSAIKFISMITKREITVRDASRFHHFKDGYCNCGDFW